MYRHHVLPNASDRFVETNKRRDEYLKTFEPEEQEDGDSEDGEEVSQKKPAEAKGNDGEAADARVATVGRVESRDGRRAGMTPAGAQGRGEESSPAGKDRGGAKAVGNAAKERLDRQAERDLIEEQLDKEATAIFNEMKECMVFHDLY